MEINCSEISTEMIPPVQISKDLFIPRIYQSDKDGWVRCGGFNFRSAILKWLIPKAISCASCHHAVADEHHLDKCIPLQDTAAAFTHDGALDAIKLPVHLHMNAVQQPHGGQLEMWLRWQQLTNIPHKCWSVCGATPWLPLRFMFACSKLKILLWVWEEAGLKTHRTLHQKSKY